MSDMFYYIFLWALFVNQTLSVKDPPREVGPLVQSVMGLTSSILNLTCPFEFVDFFKWTNTTDEGKRISLLQESQILKLTTSSQSSFHQYECEAINGYGKNTAKFFVKVVDPNSKQFISDCSKNLKGPCFLKSIEDNALFYVLSNSMKATFDCRAAVPNQNGKIKYQWKKLSVDRSRAIKNMIFKNQNRKDNLDWNRIKAQKVSNTKEKLNSFDTIENWGSLVRVTGMNKWNEGGYECKVTTSNGRAIRRYFFVDYDAINQNAQSIDGPKIQNITLQVGSNTKLDCKVRNPDHLPRWGKQLNDKDTSQDTSGYRIITIPSGKYHVLNGSLDKVQTKRKGKPPMGSYNNYLSLNDLQVRDSGTYMCALAANGEVEQKLVYLTVVDPDSTNGVNRAARTNANFPLYIAIPTVIFVLCLGSLICCCIHRALLRRKGRNYKNRAPNSYVTGSNGSAANNLHQTSGSNTTNSAAMGALANNSIGNPNTRLTGNNANNNNSNNNNNSSNSGSCSGSRTLPSSRQPMLSGGPHCAVAMVAQPSITTGYYPSPRPPQPTPYDSSSTPSPPPPTSVTDTISTSNQQPQLLIHHPHHQYVPLSHAMQPPLAYSPPNNSAASSQIHHHHHHPSAPQQPASLISSHGSSSLSAASNNQMQQQHQQQQGQLVYGSSQPPTSVGIMFSA